MDNLEYLLMEDCSFKLNYSSNTRRSTFYSNFQSKNNKLLHGGEYTFPEATDKFQVSSSLQLFSCAYVCKNIFNNFFLSSLEVEELDSISKDKEEHENKTNMSCSYSSKEVMLKSIMLLNVLLHCHPTFFCYINLRKLVTDLRCHKAIDCPGHRRCPVIPPPPYWNLLQISGMAFQFSYRKK